jgi:hypothetical protein
MESDAEQKLHSLFRKLQAERDDAKDRASQYFDLWDLALQKLNAAEAEGQKALIKERERCAKIAEKFAEANGNLNTNEKEAQVAWATAQAIANEIRGNRAHQQCSEKA